MSLDMGKSGFYSSWSAAALRRRAPRVVASLHALLRHSTRCCVTPRVVAPLHALLHLTRCSLTPHGAASLRVLQRDSTRCSVTPRAVASRTRCAAAPHALCSRTPRVVASLQSRDVQMMLRIGACPRDEAGGVHRPSRTAERGLRRRELVAPRGAAVGRREQ